VKTRRFTVFALLAITALLTLLVPGGVLPSVSKAQSVAPVAATSTVPDRATSEGWPDALKSVPTHIPKDRPAAEANAGWQEVGSGSASSGGISDNSSTSFSPMLATAPDGTSYVAWSDLSSGNYQIYIRHWNESDWVEVGAGSASGGGITNDSPRSYGPSLALSDEGDIFIAWLSEPVLGFSNIYVKHWDGINWDDLGGRVNDHDRYSKALSLVLDGNDYPVVAWTDAVDMSNSEIYIKRWNGSTWVEVGAGSASGGGISDNGGYAYDPSLAAAPDGTLYVAWSDDSAGDSEIYVLRWNGNSWEEVGVGSASEGGISNNNGSSGQPSLAVAPDGIPYVAWCDDSAGDSEIYMRRWTGNSWEEIGIGSASEGGISNNASTSYQPSLTVAPDGTLYVAWSDGIAEDSEIYVQHWNGNNWEDVGVGSASGGGISDNNDYSYAPSLAVAPDGMPYVAWSDGSAGDSEIYVRRWRGDNITPVVLVQDESGNPVNRAQVYRNGNLAGTTSVTGTLIIPELRVGDQLVARQQIAEFATAKGNHDQDASQNWAWRVYITSLDIPATGEPSPHLVYIPTLTQTLTLKRDNALIGFNILASVEWDANTSYLEELRQGFELASAYLYDASDGQMLFERVTIYDNAQFWADADYQVRASNQESPKTFPDAGGILVNGDWHIFLGRYWDSHSANQGSWTNRIGLCTPIHEFGHYALNLYDSYYYYDADGKKTSSYCTSEAIKTNLADHINATLMYWPYNASEFSMRGVNGLWSAQCEQTHQWQKNGESDWETIRKVFTDSNIPERWALKAPGDRGTVIAGPSTIPTAATAWSSATIGNNANTGICALPPEYTVTNVLNAPLEGVRVDLEKNGRVIHQGQTGADGRISVLGAADGDTVSFTQELFPGLIWIGSTQVSCVSGQSLQLAQSTQVVLDPAPFTLSASVIPDGAANQARVIVQASTSLKVAPQVHLYQSGAITPIIATMTYDAGTDEYFGMATLDNGLPSSGIIKISATDTNDQSVQIFTSFRLTQVDNTLDTTIRSNDGQVELYLPAGSLSGDGRVSIFGDAIPEAFSDGLVRLSGPYRIQPEASLGLVSNAGLTFRYLDTGSSLRNANLATAQVYRWDEAGAQWVSFSTNLLTDHQEASASIDSVGLYILLAERLDTTYLPIILKNK
jgi:hypothetical protein